MTSYGFWYPDTVIDVYRGNTVFTYTYEDSSYFGYEVEEPGVRTSFLPVLNELYRRMSLTVFQQKVPFVSMLFFTGLSVLVYDVRAGISAESEGEGKIPGSGSAISASNIGFS